MTNYIDINEEKAKELLSEMPHFGEGKKPLFSQIMVGYMLAKAIWFFNFFIDKAISCIDMSVVDMNDDGTPIDNLEVYELKAQLLEAKTVSYRLVGVAHKLAAKILKEKGYGSITNAIFKYLKIGVTRR